MINSIPNQDPADDGSMASVMNAYLRSFIRENLDDMLPAVVVSYNDATNKAVIKPLIMVGTTDGQKLSRSQLQNIPVFRFGGGGFFMRFPIKAGDFGWLKASDRDMSLMMQRGGLEDWPNTERLHSFSDAMFFPDTLKGWSIDGGNSDAAVFQSMDGSVCVALHNGKITFTAPEATFDIPIVTFTGDINTVGLLTNNGVNVGSTHTHPGVQTGSGTTGTPT